MGKRVYIAAPFFNDAEKELVHQIEDLTKELGYVSYSPSRDGIVVGKNPSFEQGRKAFYGNIEAMNECDLGVVVINEHVELRSTARDLLSIGGRLAAGEIKMDSDNLFRSFSPKVEYDKAGKDTGTIWELGYMFAMNKMLISFSTQSAPLNLMLKFSVLAHATSLEELESMLKDVLDLDHAEDDEATARKLYDLRAKYTRGGEVY